MKLLSMAAVGAVFSFTLAATGCGAAPDEVSADTTSAIKAGQPGQLTGNGTNTPAQAAACGHTYTDIEDPSDEFYVPPGNIMSVSPGEVIGAQPVAEQGDGEDVCGFAAARNAIAALGGTPGTDQDMADAGLTVTIINGTSVGVEHPNMCAFLQKQNPGAGWTNTVGNFSDTNLRGNIFNTIAEGGVIVMVISWNDAHWNQWSHHWITVDGMKLEGGKTWYRVRTWGCYVWMSEDYLISRMSKTVYVGRPFCRTTTPNVRPSENGPLPGFTASTGYSKDLNCCCATGSTKGSTTFNGPWVVMPEHQCLDNGNNFRPGTCGSGDPNARRAAGIPTDAATCEQYNADPNKWRTDHGQAMTNTTLQPVRAVAAPAD